MHPRQRRQQHPSGCDAASETFACRAKSFRTLPVGNRSPWRLRLPGVDKARDERQIMTQQKFRRYLKHGMLPQLSVFEAVARHGNYTKAGEELFMAQPTVSVQMKKLTETV